MTKDINIKINITETQGALIQQFHLEIILGDLDQTEGAYRIIFDKEPEPMDVIILKTFCMAKAAEWGSPDLAQGVEKPGHLV